MNFERPTDAPADRDATVEDGVSAERPAAPFRTFLQEEYGLETRDWDPVTGNEKEIFAVKGEQLMDSRVCLGLALGYLRSLGYETGVEHGDPASVHSMGGVIGRRGDEYVGVRLLMGVDEAGVVVEDCGPEAWEAIEEGRGRMYEVYRSQNPGTGMALEEHGQWSAAVLDAECGAALGWLKTVR